MGFEDDEPRAAEDLRLMGDQFATLLKRRGDNVRACTQIEDSNGGDSRRATPYIVAIFDLRESAEELVQEFTNIDATAVVVAI